MSSLPNAKIIRQMASWYDMYELMWLFCLFCLLFFFQTNVYYSITFKYLLYEKSHPVL